MGRSLLDAIRFFRVVPPVPRLLAGCFVVATGAGSLAILLGSPGAVNAPVPVLLLQLFSASAGFAASARRGFYDVLLTGGIGRLHAALVHWTMCILPGVSSCIVLAIAEAVGSTGEASAGSSGTAVALLVVSTVPWAITMTLPRFSGAIGWMLLSVMTLTLLPSRAGAIALGTGHRLAASWEAALSTVLFPMGMAGRNLGPTAPAVITGVLLALVSMITALVWVHRADLPLEAAQ